MRTLCAYIASTLQLKEGAENVMLTEAAQLNLGPGTEATDAAAAPAAAAVEAPESVRAGQAPPPPETVRVGQRAPLPAGVRPIRLHQLGGLLGGGFGGLQ